MKHVIFTVALAGTLLAPAFAQDRLTDRDVKALVSRIEEARDKFDDALDDDLKNKVLRGPNGEVDVKNFLNDFQKNIDRLEERLKPEYAASAEVSTLLKQGSSIDAFFRQQCQLFKPQLAPVSCVGGDRRPGLEMSPRNRPENALLRRGDETSLGADLADDAGANAGVIDAFFNLLDHDGGQLVGALFLNIGWIGALSIPPCSHHELDAGCP